LDAFSKSLIEFGVSLRPGINEVNACLTALGEPPKEGEPAEDIAVTDERKGLLEEKAQTNALLGEAKSLSIRASRCTWLTI
jgi:potassium efflux system protein